MSDARSWQALFDGLVFNEEGKPAAVDRVGGEPFYVVMDAGFRRYVEAEVIDRQVVEWLHAQVLSNREAVAQGIMSLLGKDDLFTKAMLDASIEDMDRQMAQLRQQGLPEDVRAWLGMLGFRVVVNVHGEVIEIDAPSAPDEGDW
ncbi:MAG: hypothetical protein JSV36_03225 [Anaerolineae bacterium]|nr:MAG: hypothetical protein JSV36_03225 [Anaerolineae bacterium]